MSRWFGSESSKSASSLRIKSAFPLVNGIEVPGAFDNSNDGWLLYEFPLNPTVITNGILVVEILADPQEGWGARLLGVGGDDGVAFRPSPPLSV